MRPQSFPTPEFPPCDFQEVDPKTPQGKIIHEATKEHELAHLENDVQKTGYIGDGVQLADLKSGLNVNTVEIKRSQDTIDSLTIGLSGCWVPGNVGATGDCFKYINSYIDELNQAIIDYQNALKEEED
jgi:hypothetical protein